eukprot:4443621-Prymnesium_polylepis.1
MRHQLDRLVVRRDQDQDCAFDPAQGHCPHRPHLYRRGVGGQLVGGIQLGQGQAAGRDPQAFVALVWRLVAALVCRA